MKPPLPVLDHYPSLHQDFHWQVPEYFNIAQVCCQRWVAEPQRVAIITDREDGAALETTFAQLQTLANQLAASLQAAGVAAGQRVAIVLPQCVATAAAHLAIYQIGAVAMPLSILFGPDALEYRLQDSGAVAAIVDAAVLPTIRALRSQCPDLKQTWSVSSAGQFSPALTKTETFSPVNTLAEDPAVLIYTSGTTGPAKGALIPHRALIGNLTGFVASQNWFGFGAESDPHSTVFWSPADWAWTGGLMDALLPSMYFGRPIVASRARFSAELAFTVMQRHHVTHTFLFPTALKAMMKAYSNPREQFDLRLQAVMSAGEPVGATVFAWCEQALSVRVNEMFGQTEINYIVGNSDRWPARASSMGRAYPGHRVAVIDEAGAVCPVGVAGDVAVHRCDIHGHPDPVFFLGYWRREQATQDKFTGDWCRTGDLAIQDAQGYLWYQGRADDMFKAAGYRIGPSEVENCLLGHPSVANAAVVPKPDTARGAVVKAFIVLVPGRVGTAALVAELQAHVRGKLAPYEYPKEIEFLDALPMTTTGKVQRKVLRDLEIERTKTR